MLKVKYLVPDGSEEIHGLVSHMGEAWWETMLCNMVKENPDCIFFFVTESTDVPDLKDM